MIVILVSMSILRSVRFHRRKIMAQAKMPHPGHGKHLCYLTNLGFQFSNPKDYKALVKNGKFVCRVCGRVAGKKTNLCKPVGL